MPTVVVVLVNVVQAVGLVAALAGLYLLAGVGWTLLLGGAALVVLGALYESSRPRVRA